MRREAEASLFFYIFGVLKAEPVCKHRKAFFAIRYAASL